MNVKEKAKNFAIMAHKNQLRKNEPDKPMIIHPISVGMLLEEYGYDDEVIAAGYLHDVIEDTPYTYDDIKTNFGEKVANLVMNASEPDKSLSWEERKKHTIEETKKLPLNNKLVICADKINNLEDLMLVFQQNRKRDFSKFNAGEEEQKWYYTSIYQSLIYNQDENLPIFQRLKNVLDVVFNNKQNNYLNDIFSSNDDYYNKLISLNAQKEELKKLKALCSLSKPFVIEFCGTPRTGKTTILNNLYDFFKKGGFSIELIEEFTTSAYYKQDLLPRMKTMSTDEVNITIIQEVEKQLKEVLEKKLDVILIDRSLNDRAIWNHRRFIKNDITEEKYNELIEQYSAVSKELIDMLVIFYVEAKKSLQRDYLNSLSLEDRTFLNLKNIEEYNQSLSESTNILENSVETIFRLDTNDITPTDSSVVVAKKIMIAMRKKYIKTFNDQINN